MKVGSYHAKVDLSDVKVYSFHAKVDLSHAKVDSSHAKADSSHVKVDSSHVKVGLFGGNDRSNAERFRDHGPGPALLEQ